MEGKNFKATVFLRKPCVNGMERKRRKRQRRELNRKESKENKSKEFLI